jgi:hypothetical protein
MSGKNMTVKKAAKRGKRWQKSDGLDVRFPNKATWTKNVHVTNNCAPDQNPNRIFPDWPKVVQQGPSAENCLQLSVLSAMRGMSEEVPPGIFSEIEALCVSHFDSIIASFGRSGPSYGCLVKGYKAGNLVDFVQHITTQVLSPVGYEMRMRRLERYDLKKLISLSVDGRRERVFVVFGRAVVSDKSMDLMQRVNLMSQSRITLPYLYDHEAIVPDDFWCDRKFPLHAICIKYDREGNGVIDDPAKHRYYSMNIPSFYQCLGLHYAVYEFSIVKIPGSNCG